MPLHVPEARIQARHDITRSAPGSELRPHLHLIDLLQTPLPVNSPQIPMPRASSLSEDSANSLDFVNGENQERSNAFKCREYREKKRAKRREEEMEIMREKDRNDKLREIYSKKQSDIKRLKEYYLDYISGHKCLKRHCRKKLKTQQSQRDSSFVNDTKISPLVLVKAEIELNADVLVKGEQVEKNPPSISSS